LAQLEQAVGRPAAGGPESLSGFQQNPFDPRLRAHKIHRLSAHYGRTIYAVDIAADLRAAFYVEGETVWSVSIGTHAIYES
jgi:hypothetical protein